MLLIDRRETDPFFNLAAEEYVLKSFSEEVFMLWTSDASVVVGKHQVAAAEANLPYTWKASIPVIRRISGGGTVYHDPGNLNFSIVAGGEKEKLVDYARYTRGVIRGLAGLSVDAALQGKSSLFTGGLKFSGNAAHVYKNRVLHHGTLLFNTDLQQLRKCIRPDHRHYHDRSVRSVDSRITNLIDHLPKGMDMTAFREHTRHQGLSLHQGRQGSHWQAGRGKICKARMEFRVFARVQPRQNHRNKQFTGQGVVGF